MTIKKRLFISNILMIVIPVILSMITVFVCLFIINVISQGTFYEALRKAEEMQELQFEDYRPIANAQIMLLGFLLIAGVITVVYFTNRFLTKFVFAKVEQPLNVLTKGVHQIRDGNLDHEIIYYQEDEFKPICEDFNEMARRLKASVTEVQKNERNRKELLASISHDLRSPLTSIKAYVEGLIDGVAATPEAQREYLQIIKTKTDDINLMVSKIFLFSKMDMGEYPCYPENLDIGKEITDFVNASHEEYKQRGLLIDTVSVPAEKYIFADPTHLRSIFVNILDNSTKYKEREMVRVCINSEVTGNVVRILIEDDGPGVPIDTLPFLFDTFYRSDPSRNNPQKGSGLGLAIVAKAVERMNGRIYAQNRKEKGLCIIMEIPETKGDAQR